MILPSLGEHLLRCGIDTSSIYVFTSPNNHTRQFTSGEHLLRCGIDTSIYIVIIIINTLQSNNLSRTTVHLRNRAPPQGLGNPPKSHRLRETPYTTSSLPCSVATRYGFSVTQNGRVSPIRGRG